MKQTLHILLLPALAAALLLSACRTHKHAAETAQTAEAAAESPAMEPEPIPAPPAWQTCMMQGAQATVYWNEQSIQSSCSIYTTRDSLIILSVTPILGIELYRIEATPTQLIGIDKMLRRCLVTTYDELNTYIVPSISYADLQDLASGEMKTPEGQPARIAYKAGKTKIGLSVTYPERITNVPVPCRMTDISRYSRMDIKDWF